MGFCSDEQAKAFLQTTPAVEKGMVATSIENLRQITDNLRDLTEETKRYPASVIFGAPPAPLERK